MARNDSFLKPNLFAVVKECNWDDILSQVEDFKFKEFKEEWPSSFAPTLLKDCLESKSGILNFRGKQIKNSNWVAITHDWVRHANSSAGVEYKAYTYVYLVECALMDDVYHYLGTDNYKGVAEELSTIASPHQLFCWGFEKPNNLYNISVANIK